MACIWFDEESEVCLNGDCPVCADFCPLFEYKGVCRYEELENRKMTNADRIRAMSDEELVSFLLKIFGNGCFGEGMFPYHPCPKDRNCKNCGLDWLQQPAEG